MMGEVMTRMNQNRAFESHYPELQSIADKIIAHTKNFEGLLITVRESIITSQVYSFSYSS